MGQDYKSDGISGAFFAWVSFSEGSLILIFRKRFDRGLRTQPENVRGSKEIVTVTLRSKPPVLRWESADEYTSLHKKLIEEIVPRGAIEAVYVEEITALIWDIKRLRNCKVSVIHQTSRRALENILKQLLPSNKIKGDALPDRWFEENEAAKEEVSEILKRFDLDESAIEAEAIKLASDQLEWLDKALVLAISRLDKSLRFIKSYRAGFADDVRRQTDRLLIADVTPQRPAA
jgi:hypothetical protein